MEEEDLLDSHPDLVDPEWRRRAEAGARAGARKDRRRARTRRAPLRRPRGRWWGATLVLLVLGVTVAAIVLVGSQPKAESAAPNPTAVPVVAPVDLARPYDRTPAQNWSKGFDGIATAAAEPGAVTEAYAQVKRAIFAARLEPAVVTGHDPRAFLAQLAPDARPWIASNVAEHGKGLLPYVTEIADGYRLLDAGPRIFGTLTAHPGAKPGELAVDAKYVVAYAFDDPHPADLTGPAEIVSFVRVDENYVLRSGTGFSKTSQGLWIDGEHSGFSSVGCAAAKTGFLAPGYANPPVGPAPTGGRDAPGYYDPKYPVPTLDGCRD
ncbi:hypothetical protein AB0878_10700 [Amycolatopsis sp. NPDC047767]|uniref:hypothetical protein n=1 Tax=Amycolatopsis sp. NPDC047767 TaxID=3156765 RepID=UPI003454FD2F